MRAKCALLLSYTLPLLLFLISRISLLQIFLPAFSSIINFSFSARVQRVHRCALVFPLLIFYDFLGLTFFFRCFPSLWFPPQPVLKELPVFSIFLLYFLFTLCPFQQEFFFHSTDSTLAMKISGPHVTKSSKCFPVLIFLTS